MRKALLKNSEICVISRGDNRKQDKEFLLQIEGRWYDPNAMEWFIPLNQSNLDILVAKGFPLDDSLKPYYIQNVENEWRSLGVTLPDFLYDYQVESIKYAMYHKNRAGWVLRMGRGKTLTALSMALCVPNSLPALMITPSPVKINFKNDYDKFFGDTGCGVEILSGLDSIKKYNENKIYVVNYEIISRHVITLDVPYVTKKGENKVRQVRRLTDEAKEFISTNFKMVVVDECQRLKNDESSAFFFFKELTQDIENVICMSGTPLLNSPAELYSWFTVLKPHMWPEKYAFLNKYCGAQTIRLGNRRKVTTHKGVTHKNLLELNTKLRNNGLLVFDDSELKKTMPDEPGMWMTPIDIKDKSHYYEVYDEVKQKIAINSGYAFTLFGALKKAIADLKVDYVIELLEVMLESEQKIVVFAIHQEIVQRIADHFGKKAVIFNGTVSSAKKDKAKEAFINDPKVNLIIGNVQSLGVGVDGLQKSGACTMLFVEFPWTPAEIAQAIGRLWRTGFEGDKGINVYFTLVKDTIEERLIKKLDMKKSVIQATIDGTVVEDHSLLQNMVEMILNEAP